MEEQKQPLEDIIKAHPLIWRGREGKFPSEHSMDTGYQELNAILPTGGWPVNSIIEIVVEEWGSGELQVLLPLMTYLSQEKRYLALVSPPYLPYAPALHNAGIALNQLLIIDNNVSAVDRWWSAEKILRHDDCGLVMIWPERPRADQIRRLQVAADAGSSMGVIFHRGQPVDTPVSLRLKLGYCREGISVQVMKSRFSWKLDSTVISRP